VNDFNYPNTPCDVFPFNCRWPSKLDVVHLVSYVIYCFTW